MGLVFLDKVTKKQISPNGHEQGCTDEHCKGCIRGTWDYVPERQDKIGSTGVGVLQEAARIVSRLFLETGEMDAASDVYKEAVDLCQEVFVWASEQWSNQARAERIANGITSAGDAMTGDSRRDPLYRGHQMLANTRIAAVSYIRECLIACELETDLASVTRMNNHEVSAAILRRKAERERRLTTERDGIE